MRTKVLLGAAVVLMLTISVATIGSNMGFKISIPLYTYVAGTHTGLNWVALPYYVNYPNAQAIWTELSAIPGIGTVELDQYQESDGTTQVYDGDLGLQNFDVAPAGSLSNANAILIKVGAKTDWVVVGSHNPGMSVPLYSYAAGSHTGLNWRSLPYHTTAADAATLWNQLAALPGIGTVELDQYQETDGTSQVYDGDLGLQNFSIVPGQALLIKVGATVTTWTPAHY